jgi:hypothetical protein
MQQLTLPGILILLCSLLCLVALFVGLNKALSLTFWDKTWQSRFFWTSLLLIGGWVILLAALSLRGFFADLSRLPPRPGLALLLPLPVILAFLFSSRGKELLRAIPPHWLIYFQSFRIGVEIILWLAVIDGNVPVQMSFEGRNFDVLSGLFALPVGYYCFIKKSWRPSIALLYNIGGLLLLINIILISLLSMPGPLRAFHNEPANTLLGHFPFILLPGFLVPLAYGLHCCSLRQLALGRNVILQQEVTPSS